VVSAEQILSQATSSRASSTQSVSGGPASNAGAHAVTGGSGGSAADSRDGSHAWTQGRDTVEPGAASDEFDRDPTAHDPVRERS
jgi:hypothetical protein